MSPVSFIWGVNFNTFSIDACISLVVALGRLPISPLQLVANIVFISRAACAFVLSVYLRITESSYAIDLRSSWDSLKYTNVVVD